MNKLLYTLAAMALMSTGAMACEGCTPTFHNEYSSTSVTSETHKNDRFQATTPMIGNWVNAAKKHTLLLGSGGGGATVSHINVKSVADNNCDDPGTGKNRN